MKRGKVAAPDREAAFLRDILVEGKDVEDFTKGMNLATFSSNRLVRKAVTKCLESIAEATKNLTPTLKARHPGISWKQIAAFRDFSAHHYWEIDYGIVWDVVRTHLPQLLAAAQQELKKHGVGRT
jgi:uncharacterized protein with HEPN domain